MIHPISKLMSLLSTPVSSTIPRGGAGKEADAAGPTATASVSAGEKITIRPPATASASDGRAFVWVRARNGTRSPMHAQIIFSKGVGKPSEIVAEHVLMPTEYGDDLNTLIARYPSPTVILDFQAKEQNHGDV